MTGKNPGKHNIYGFVDRQANSYETFIPSSKNMTSETLWEYLSRMGKRVVVINVPVTYHPRKVNGILVGCFLTPDLSKGVYPETVYPLLKEMGYRIDIDSWQARESKEKFLEDLNYTLGKRWEAARYFLKKEDWDFFMVHFMDTDRLHHFLWESMERGDEKFAPAFFQFYARIDEILGELASILGEETFLLILSDHGFCSVKKEVYLNYWLQKQGWLKFKVNPPKSLVDIHEESFAYSLIPGRVYVNLKGREPWGQVEPGSEYEAVRRDLIQSLNELRNPENGEKLIDRIFKREEIYTGLQYPAAPDLVVLPRDGYDLKGDLAKPVLMGKGSLSGMHTYENAFFFLRGKKFIKDQLEITDAMPTILYLFGLPIPEDLDGSVCIS